MPRSHHRLSAHARPRTTNAASAHCQVSSVTTSTGSPIVVAERFGDLAVGGGEFVTGTGLERLAARRFGDEGEILGSHRHGNHIAARRVDDLTVLGPEGDRVHRDARGGRVLSTFLGRPPDRRLTVTEQDHHAGCLVGVGVGVGRIHEQPRACCERFADRRRLGEFEVVDAAVHRGPIEGGVDLDVDVAGERDESDLHAVVDLGDEVPRRLLGCDEPVGIDVVGHHRQRHVEEHEDPSLAVHVLGGPVDGSRGCHDGEGEPEQHQDRNHVAAPAGPLRCDPVEQVDLREAHCRRPPPPQDDDVGNAERDDEQEQPEALGGEEVGAHRSIPSPRTACTRLRRVCCTIAPSQSLSVDSSMTSAPDRPRAVVAPVAFLGGRGGEALLHLGGHSDLPDRAGRRVDHVDEADRRDVVLTGIVHGDGEQVVAEAQPGEGRLPAIRPRSR